MTVQELIEVLQEIEDKEMSVVALSEYYKYEPVIGVCLDGTEYQIIT